MTIKSSKHANIVSNDSAGTNIPLPSPDLKKMTCNFTQRILATSTAVPRKYRVRQQSVYMCFGGKFKLTVPGGFERQ